MSEFRGKIKNGERLLFDGAMGTMLQARGLAPGESPELFCLANPAVLTSIHSEYAEAGADVLTTNTFGGTAFKLPDTVDVEEFNRLMAVAARQAADEMSRALGRRIFVAGSVGPTGKFLRPLGDLSFEEMTAAFQAQIRGLMRGGIDLVLAETQFDMAEARAVVVAARREGRLPVAVSMTYEDSVTLTGSSVEVCAATLANLGVEFAAMNCSAGPVEMRDAALTLLAASPVPVLIQPNAGLPRLEGERTVFPLGPDEFARLTTEFARAGAQAVGGCCGTTPAHIKALAREVRQLPPPAERPAQRGIALTSRSRLVRIGRGHPLAVIGERINPTGKKALTAELQAGEFTTALTFADEQLAAGAPVLDVNVGAPLVDETVLLPDLVARLASRVNAPLALDSSNIHAVAAGLGAYPASPLVNSISGEEGRMEFLGPLCRDYGAPFILLPLRGKELPLTAKDRIVIVEDLLRQMEDLGVPRRLALVDVLALTVSSSPLAGKECLDFISHCRDVLDLPTVCGLSNISFGLPAREVVNAAFLGLAAGAGLSACIANPGSRRIAETVDAANLLLGHDTGAESFIGKYAGWTSAPPAQSVPSGVSSPSPSGSASPAGHLTIEEAVIAGRREAVEGLVRKALEEGEKPFTLVDQRLIPAITEVGEKYERKEYFLPQLIRSAETMQAAFALLRPLLEKEQGSGKRPVIILATVEGDIHDIGKNIVGLMLGNHGFEVVDLGKDVGAEAIVRAALDHDAALVGLSALMTTTMVRMRDTVDLLREKNMPQPVLVGGAVVTETFAESIGAHHARDAVDAVRLAKNLLQ